MGIFGSSEETNEEKMVDSNGNVNNNIIIQEAHDTHDTMKMNQRMLNVMYLMCSIEIVKLGLYIFCRFKKSLKKKYNQNS